jgi:mannose-1-phosphate guanylyltransferase
MAGSSTARITPVILSGGAGTRLWPLSRGDRPKQLLGLTADETMLRLTARRVADPELYNAPTVVAAAAQADEVEAEVEGMGRLILEPCARNTAPAIALAALQAAGDELLLVLPSDHAIADVGGFNEAVRTAASFAADGWIVTFGMQPDRPETGYGDIRRGAALAPGVYAAERFVEKPDLVTASRYLAEGGYDWNGGIFLMRADTLIEGLGTHAPGILAAARQAVEAQKTEGLQIKPAENEFAASPAASIDYALMERADRVAVVPGSVGWSDIGGWSALHKLAAKDKDDNVVAGKVFTIDASGSLIRSEGPLIAAIGVKDLVIVATADAVLVAPLSEAQRVKEIVDRLKAEGGTEWT